MDSVTALLREHFGSELTTDRGDDVLVREEKVTEYDIAWSVPFNSRPYIETGNPIKFLLPGVCLVPKDEPERAHFPPTYLPVEEYLEKVRSGEMTWAR